MYFRLHFFLPFGEMGPIHPRHETVHKDNLGICFVGHRYGCVRSETCVLGKIGGNKDFVHQKIFVIKLQLIDFFEAQLHTPAFTAVYLYFAPIDFPETRKNLSAPCIVETMIGHAFPYGIFYQEHRPCIQYFEPQ